MDFLKKNCKSFNSFRGNSALIRKYLNALHVTIKIKEQLYLGQDKMAKNDVHVFVGLRTHSRREDYFQFGFRNAPHFVGS